MKLKYITLTLCLTGLTTAGGNTVLAASGVNYPGSMCQTFYGSDASQTHRYQNGLASDAGTGRISVVCPILKQEDKIVNPITSYVRLYSADYDYYTECKVIAFDWKGQNSRSGSPAKITGPKFAGVDVYGPRGYAGGTQSLYCNLPKGSRIANYFVFD